MLNGHTCKLHSHADNGSTVTMIRLWRQSYDEQLNHLDSDLRQNPNENPLNSMNSLSICFEKFQNHTKQNKVIQWLNWAQEWTEHLVFLCSNVADEQFVMHIITLARANTTLTYEFEQSVDISKKKIDLTIWSYVTIYVFVSLQ